MVLKLSVLSQYLFFLLVPFHKKMFGQFGLPITCLHRLSLNDSSILFTSDKLAVAVVATTGTSGNNKQRLPSLP